MKSKLLAQAGEKTFAVVFETGDEVIAGLTGFARQQKLSASHFTAIGGFCDLILGYLEIEHREYKKIPLHEQVEVVSLAGDISLQGDEARVHAHVVVGRSDGSARRASHRGPRAADAGGDPYGVAGSLAPGIRSGYRPGANSLVTAVVKGFKVADGNKSAK